MARNRGSPFVGVIGCDNPSNHQHEELNWCNNLFFYADYGTEEMRAGEIIYVVSADRVSGVAYAASAIIPYYSLRRRVREMLCVSCDRTVGYELNGICHFNRFISIWLRNGANPNLIGEGVEDNHSSDDSAHDDEGSETDDEASHDDGVFHYFHSMDSFSQHQRYNFHEAHRSSFANQSLSCIEYIFAYLHVGRLKWISV